jgi:dolichyl-phosphate-mannose-protein mannosyltransferase
MFEPPVRIQDPARRQRVLLVVAAILLISAALRLYQIADPARFMVDEIYYAKDAKAIVDGRIGPKPPLLWEAGDEVSWPHPEMGKLAIAAGIVVFGDRAFGWRFPSMVAGIVVLALVYPLARRLGLPPPWALIALAFAAADPLNIAMSRIAMLDIFVAVWSVLCVFLVLKYVQDGRRWYWLVLAGLAGGMAFGTKVSGAMALVAAAVILVLAWVRDRRAARAAAASEEPGAGEEGAAAPAESLGRALRRALPSALVAAAVLVLVPLGVWMLSYTLYFTSGHTWSQFVELQRQALFFNLHLHTPHIYESPPYTWIIDKRPWWNYFESSGHSYRGVVAMGNPFLWWLATGGLVIAFALAVARRSYLLLPTAIIVAALYFPWFAITRTSFIYYMTPVAPFLAILVAGLLLLVAGRVALPRYGVPVLLGMAVATALLWDVIAGFDPFRHLPHTGPGWVGIVVGVGVAVVALLALSLSDSPRARTARPYVAMVLAGMTVGIVVAFLPVVLNIPVSPQHFSHMMWFRSWI